ncbi:MAG: CsbD family protein [Planctomycetaceae bacterium]|nr:CsbD family protein [Planctomycetaceae bacterium]
MITRQELEGQWNQVKGQVQERWGEFSDNELREARGSADQLVGVIQQKTGESRRAIEDFLEQVVENGGTIAQQAADTARAYSEHASETAQEQYEQVSQKVREGYEHAGQMVQRKPIESVAVAFGAGIVAGVVVGLVLKSR